MNEREHEALVADILRDLSERLTRADLELTRMTEVAVGHGADLSAARLRGKASGVRLARSYVEEMLR